MRCSEHVRGGHCARKTFRDRKKNSGAYPWTGTGSSLEAGAICGSGTLDWRGWSHMWLITNSQKLLHAAASDRSKECRSLSICYTDATTAHHVPVKFFSLTEIMRVHMGLLHSIRVEVWTTKTCVEVDVRLKYFTCVC
jgi:hypothetical protein